MMKETTIASSKVESDRARKRYAHFAVLPLENTDSLFRLRTRIAYVQQSEQALAQKKVHCKPSLSPLSPCLVWVADVSQTTGLSTLSRLPWLCLGAYKPVSHASCSVARMFGCDFACIWAHLVLPLFFTQKKQHFCVGRTLPSRIKAVDCGVICASLEQITFLSSNSTMH
jgi:hypothetical protein